MTVQTIYASKDASFISTSVANWSGTDWHHPVGRLSDDSATARSVIYFPLSLSGKTITAAVLNLRGSKSGASHASGDTTSKTIYIRRATETWSEGTAEAEGTWGSHANDSVNSTTTGEATKSFSSGIVDETWYTVDILDIVQSWKNGSANYGVVLVNSNTTDPDDGVEFYSREKGAAYAPYLTLTYTTNVAPNSPVSTDPSGDEVVSTLLPFLSGTFSDPDSGDSMSAYQVQMYQDDGTTLLWDSGTLAKTGTTFSKQYPSSATVLVFGDFYQWRARTRDAAGLWGPWTSMQRFQVVDDTPPDAITGLSATPGTTSITIGWNATELAVLDFDHYEVYRREVGDEDWDALISIYDPDTLTFEDLTPEFGADYEYKVTQFKNATGGFDIEGPDSDIAEATVEGSQEDVWSVIGADGEAEHTFDLHVIDGPIRRPIQQEIFEPLGSSRKTVVRGRVLGSEGSLTMIYTSDERSTGLTQIDYITENRGPHVLRSPFGDVWLVEFGGTDREDMPAGHVKITLPWTEVA
jgi:hypothetical protein